MVESLLQQLESALGSFGVVAYPVAFGAGVVTSLNPCVYGAFPAIVAFIGAQGEVRKARAAALSLTFVLGLALVYGVLGAGASLLGGLLGPKVWFYLAAVVCLVVGLHLAGVLPLKFSALIPAQSSWSRLSGFGGALALGVLFGLVTSPCATPVLALVVTLAAAKGAALYGGTVLFVFALGNGVPLVILGTATAAITSLQKLSVRAEAVQKVGGWVLVGVGLYLLWLA